MRQSAKGEGTKIAQAAKDLNVTSVTIRRYISEFNIETTSDENGIKVLPEQAMEELHEIRRLKEDGLTNPKVLEHLEEMRAKGPKTRSKKEAEPAKKTAKRAAPAKEEKEEAEPKKETKRAERKVVSRKAPVAPVEDEEEEESEEAAEPVEAAGGAEEAAAGEEGVAEIGDGKSKHTLTCQTCGKTFEHMNPRLRDCLECYRAKRKERRRGGDKNKNVIQHPLAQQAASRQQQRQPIGENGADEYDVVPEAPVRAQRPAGRIDATPPAAAAREAAPLPLSSKRINPLAGIQKQQPVRNYRKAIEETRGITANLKRRLERPDLPENERRWLEQIYAYQLILHQGWRHLAEYKAGNQPQKAPQD